MGDIDFALDPKTCHKRSSLCSFGPPGNELSSVDIYTDPGWNCFEQRGSQIILPKSLSIFT